MSIIESTYGWRKGKKLYRATLAIKRLILFAVAGWLVWTQGLRQEFCIVVRNRKKAFSKKINKNVINLFNVLDSVD